MPLRDKVRLSESSISKIPTAYQWGQTLPVYCAALSKPPPLAKGRLVVDQAIQLDFSTVLEMTGEVEVDRARANIAAGAKIRARRINGACSLNFNVILTFLT